ncbi:MAG: polyketide cyclase [Pararhizobium sp.]
MLQSKVITVSIDRNWRDVYERFWRPEVFPTWASGLSEAGLEQDGGEWTARGPEGPVRIRFSPHNPFGVMDHWVDLGEGRIVYVPLRIIENGSGTEVMLTLFRQADMDDARFAEDERWIRRDLEALKRLAEG